MEIEYRRRRDLYPEFADQLPEGADGAYLAHEYLPDGSGRKAWVMVPVAGQVGLEADENLEKVVREQVRRELEQVIADA